jgi:hypothetical protein
MNFKQHSELDGQHAFLSGSKYHWINYDKEKIADAYRNYLKVKKGTDIHALASEAIRLGIRLPTSRKSLDQYVNDAIGYRMTPEQPLFYSNNAFGTADCITFREVDNTLRIHDLKTGVSPTSIHQLEVYAALFCLEYQFNPCDIYIELRIYQKDTILVETPSGDVIQKIMDKIIRFDKQIDEIRMEEE